METNITPPSPGPTSAELQHILDEALLAGDELKEMLQIGGDLNAMWQIPRKYFVRESDTAIPIPNEYLRALVAPVWSAPDSTGFDGHDIACEIILQIQLIEMIPREIISERFQRKAELVLRGN